jgi:hypothetical protein
MEARREALLAASNNVDWYTAVFRSLGLSGAIEHGVWTSRDEAPAYHSNAVILSPGPADLQREIIRRLAANLGRPFSFKDAFASRDFGAEGFKPLFDAVWIWRDAGTPSPLQGSDVKWHRVTTEAELATWEADLLANGSPADKRVFLPRLLGDSSMAFFTARDRGGVIGGCAANRSVEVVGFSNFFTVEPNDARLRAGAVAAVADFASGFPVVGYERGEALAAMERLGFRAIQPLRIWLTADC